MLWGCSSLAGAETLASFLIDVSVRKTAIHHQENCRKHPETRTADWLRTKHIYVIEWPSQSPTLEPIEIMWKVLKFDFSQTQSGF